MAFHFAATCSESKNDRRRIWLSAIASAFTLWSATVVGAAEPALLGRQVMLRDTGGQIDSTVVGQPGGVGATNSWEVLTVLREREGKVWVRNRDSEGWLPATSVVPVEDAVDWFTKQIDASPQDESAYAHRARAHHFLGDYEKAISDFTEALKLSPSGSWIWNNRAIVYSDMKEYDRSLADYTKAIEINASYYLALSNRGMIWMRKKEFAKAHQDLARSIEMNPQYGFVYSNRAIVWLAQNKPEEAVKDCDKALRINPGATGIRSVRGQVFLALKRYDDAIQELNMAIRLEPCNSSAYAYRSRVRNRMADHAGAERDIVEAIRLRPMIDWYYCDYSHFLATTTDAKLRNIKKAEEMLEQARRRNVDQDGRYFAVCAAVAAEAGRFADAVELQQKANRDEYLSPDDKMEYERRLSTYRAKQPWRE